MKDTIRLVDWLVPFPDLGDESVKSSKRPTAPDDAPTGKLPPADPERIKEGCAWFRHFAEHPAEQSEIDWYHLLSISGRCIDGRALAHSLSQGHPGYTPGQTDEKLAHAIEASEPVTCETIRSKGCGKFCADCSFGRRNGYGRSPVLLGTDIPKTGYNFTDIGNAKRFCASFRETVRYDSKGGKWLIWNEKYWRRDEHNSIKLKVDEMLHQMRAEGLEAGEWAYKCEDAARFNAIAKLSEPFMSIDRSDLDNHKHLLVCRNGTVDLRDGTIHPHDPALLITRLCDVDYYPGMKNKTWDDFLLNFCGKDLELVKFLQTAWGYSATGSTQEERFFIMYGKGGSGKGTFVDAMRSVLGENYETAESATFLKNERAIRNDLAKLDGCRVVTTNEPNKGAELDAGLVKQATGRDPLTARFLNKEFFTFVPQFKPWFLCNDKPKVRANDSGIWRRIVPMAFMNQPQEVDKTLKDRLVMPDVKSAVFAWIVEGAVRWYQEGLVLPACVEREVAKYRAESDPLSRWMTECVMKDPEGVAPISMLRRSYENFCRENEDEPISLLGYNRMLEEKGHERRGKKVDGIYTKIWTGLKLKEF